MFPDEDRQAARHDPGIRAAKGHPFPVERKEHDRAEARAETGPCVGNNLENVTIRIGSEVECARGNGEHGRAGDE